LFRAGWFFQIIPGFGFHPADETHVGADGQDAFTTARADESRVDAGDDLMRPALQCVNIPLRVREVARLAKKFHDLEKPACPRQHIASGIILAMRAPSGAR